MRGGNPAIEWSEEVGFLQTLTSAIDLGAPILRLHALSASLGAIVGSERAIHFHGCGLVLGFGSSESGAVIPVFEVSQDLTTMHVISFTNVNLVDHTVDFRFHLRRSGGSYGGSSIDAHGDGENCKKQDQARGTGNEQGAATFFEGQEFLLFLQNRPQEADERNFFVERSIAHCDGRLASEDADHLQVRFVEKIGVAAFEQQEAEAAFVVGKRECIEGAHAGVGEIFAEGRFHRFFGSVDFALVFPLGNKDSVANVGDSGDDVFELRDLASTGVDLLDARNGFQAQLTAFVQRDGGALVRNYGAGRVDDCLQNTIEVERGSD